MAATGVRRIVVISVAGILTIPTPDRPDPPRRESGAGFLTHHVLGRLARYVLRDQYADVALMEDILRNSGLDWTSVQVPLLTDNPATGAYRMAYGQSVRGSFRITRADAALCMLRVLGEPETIKRPSASPTDGYRSACVSTAYVAVTLLAIVVNTFSGGATLTDFKPIMPGMVNAGVPHSWLTFPIGTPKTAGAAGLVLGLIGLPMIGTAAAAALLRFFVCAAYTHLLLRGYSIQLWLAAGFLLLAIARWFHDWQPRWSHQPGRKLLRAVPCLWQAKPGFPVLTTYAQAATFRE